MLMRNVLVVFTAVALFTGLTAGCDEDVGGMAEECSMPALLVFKAREYVAVRSFEGVAARDVTVGRRLGAGELPACGEGPGQPVRVFKIDGVAATEAVFAKPAYGLMARSNRDGTEK